MQTPHEIQASLMDKQFYQHPNYHPYLWHIQSIYSLLDKVAVAERKAVCDFLEKLYSYLFVSEFCSIELEPGVFFNLTEKAFLHFETAEAGSIPAKTFCTDFFIASTVLLKFYADEEIWNGDFQNFIKECEYLLDMRESVLTTYQLPIHEFPAKIQDNLQMVWRYFMNYTDSPDQSRNLKPHNPLISKWMRPLENKRLADWKFDFQINWEKLDAILQTNTNLETVLSLMAFQETWSDLNSDYQTEIVELMQKYGSMQTLQSLIEKQAIITLPEHRNLLYISTAYELTDAFKCLIDANKKPDSHTLLCAVKMNQTEIFNRLLDDYGLETSPGMIFCAIKWNNLEIVNRLLADDLEVTTEMVMCAVKRNYPKIVKRLLDIQDLKIHADTLLFAVQQNYLEIVKLLAPGIPIDLKLLKEFIDTKQILTVKYLVAIAQLNHAAFFEILQHTLTTSSSRLLTALLWDRFGLFDARLEETWSKLKQSGDGFVVEGSRSCMKQLQQAVKNNDDASLQLFAWEYNGILNPYVDNFCELLAKDPATASAGERLLKTTIMLRKAINDADYPTILLWVWKEDGLKGDFVNRMKNLFLKDPVTILTGEILYQNSELLHHASRNIAEIKNFYFYVWNTQGLFGQFVDDFIATLLQLPSMKGTARALEETTMMIREAVNTADYTIILYFIWQNDLEEMPLDILKNPINTPEAQQTATVLAELNRLLKKFSSSLEVKTLRDMTSELLSKIRPIYFKEILGELKKSSNKIVHENVRRVEREILPNLRPSYAHYPGLQFPKPRDATQPPTQQGITPYTIT